MAREEKNNVDDSNPMDGAKPNSSLETEKWNKVMPANSTKKRMDVELAYKTFGHHSVSALMNASKSEV